MKIEKEKLELIQLLIERWDSGRLDLHGGYPSDYEIINDLIIIADVDHDDAPRLTVAKVDDWMAEELDSIADFEFEEVINDPIERRKCAAMWIMGKSSRERYKNAKYSEKKSNERTNHQLRRHDR